MRILTVRQPWAWAIIHGGKDVENRTRNIAGDYRGPVAIHVGKRDDDEYHENPTSDMVRGLMDVYDDNRRATFGPLDPRDAPWWSGYGQIIGVVDLKDVHYCHAAEDECTSYMGLFPCSPWGNTFGIYHLVLANPRPLTEPIPYKGALGMRTLPADIEARVLADLAKDNREVAA